jgi:hypothetical protein
LNPTSGTVGAVQTSNRPGRFSNGRSGLKLDRGPLLDGWCGSKPDWAVGPGQDRLDIFKNTAGVVWWGRLTLKEGRSHSELDGPVGAGRVANGAGIQALRGGIIGFEWQLGTRKKIGSCGSLVKGEA